MCRWGVCRSVCSTGSLIGETPQAGSIPPLVSQTSETVVRRRGAYGSLTRKTRRLLVYLGLKLPVCVRTVRGLGTHYREKEGVGTIDYWG